MDPRPGPSRLGPWQMLIPSPPPPSPPRHRRTTGLTSSSSTLPLSSITSSSAPTAAAEAGAQLSLPSSSSSNAPGKRRRRNKSTASMRRVWLAAALAFVALSGQRALLGATAAAAPPASYLESLEQRGARFASSSPWKGKARDTSAAHTDAPINAHFLAASAGDGTGADAADAQERVPKAMYPDRNGERSRQAIVEANLGKLSRSKVPFEPPSPTAKSITLRRRDSAAIMNEYGSKVERGTRLVARQAAHAYASGIIADWTHQGRSVWFQRKAIIIVSCFLAIFIVLIIGAAAFLRSRQTEEELSLEEQENQELADEAALKRMKEERMMRSGGRNRRKVFGEDEKRDSEELLPGKRKKRKGRKSKAMAGETGSVTGSSTAVSRMRVSRWIKAPAAFVRANRGSGEQTLASDTTDATSIRSSQSTPSRRQRLGDVRTERTEVEYSSPSTGGDDGSLQPVLSDPTSTSTVPTDASNGSGSSPGRAVALDASDLQAAEAAGAAREQVLPPAYIPAAGQSGSNLPSQSLPPAVGEDASFLRPAYQRPLAGSEVVVTDAKHPSGADMGAVAPPSSSSALQQLDFVDETSDANREGAAHIATDDKARLAALAAAASAPATTSAPFYSSGEAASAPSDDWSASDTSPSAPALDVDEEGFEQAAMASLAGATTSGASSQVAPSYSRANDSRALSDSRAKTAQSSLLPQPPRPHSQAFSPFDRPYHHMMPYTPSPGGRDESSRVPPPSVLQPHTSPAAVPTAAESAPSSPLQQLSRSDNDADEDATMSADRRRRRAEKQREADEESALTPSSPGDFAAAGLGTAGAVAAGLSLPAYSGRSSYGGVGAEAGADVATAPAIEALFEENEQGGAPPGAEDYGGAPDTSGPSAPPPEAF